MQNLHKKVSENEWRFEFVISQNINRTWKKIRRVYLQTNIFEIVHILSE